MARKILALLILFGVLGAGAGAFVVTWGYYYYSRDLPDFTNVLDFNPQAVTNVYANDGTLIAEFFDERRYPCPIEKVPLIVRQAFLAAEDSAFYEHFGIDPVGILRAAVKNLQAGSASQGASTITQQVIKNVLLTREKSITRKIKEAILAYRLEQELSKDEILEIYLNQIYFGNGAYGIKAAVRSYFHRDLSRISLAQAALLAGLPKAPSRYNPIKNFAAARRRQKYVLDQMVKAGFVASERAQEALHEELTVFPASTDKVYEAPYYVGEVRRRFAEIWESYDIDTDGLEIHTALDLKANEFAQRALRQGVREIDKRRGWRGPVRSIEQADHNAFVKYYGSQLLIKPEAGRVYPAMVKAIKGNSLSLDFGESEGAVSLKGTKWASKLLLQDDDGEERVVWRKPQEVLRIGDVIEVSAEIDSEDSSKVTKFNLDQEPQVESALVLLDPHSGKVISALGGYDYRRSQFNRATQGRRQPGSSFKPIVYLTALDEFGYTPSTIVDDSARTFKVGQDYWSPANYDKGFLGPITLRTALQKSRNIVSADIISRIGVDSVIRFARKMGVTSPLGRNLSLSLGSSEVTPLEITRAYGVLAAQGVLFDSVFVTNVFNRHGEEVYSFEESKLSRAREVIDPSSAFVMANMMKGVVQYGTGYLLKQLKRPVAGKTGTSNDQMDGWFVGFTPEWALGVWVGFDVKKTIGKKETGGRVAAPIWLYLMRDFLEYQDEKKNEQLLKLAKQEARRLGVPLKEPEPVKPLDFPVPDGVDPHWVNRSTGQLIDRSSEGAFLEYFIRGTQPSQSFNEVKEEEYWDYPEL